MSISALRANFDAFEAKNIASTLTDHQGRSSLVDDIEINSTENALDCIWVLSQTLFYGNDIDKERRQKFIAWASAILEKCQVSFDEILISQEPEDLQDLKVIPDASVFRKQQIRFNTQTLYQQQKFNIQWENIRGFAALIVNLEKACRFKADLEMLDQNSSIPKQTNTVLSSLLVKSIGSHSLEPWRCVDAVLDLFASSPTDELMSIFETTIPSNDFLRKSMVKLTLSKLSANKYPFFSKIYLSKMISTLIENKVLNFCDISSLFMPLNDFQSEVSSVASKRSLQIKDVKWGLTTDLPPLESIDMEESGNAAMISNLDNDDSTPVVSEVESFSVPEMFEWRQNNEEHSQSSPLVTLLIGWLLIPGISIDSIPVRLALSLHSQTGLFAAYPLVADLICGIMVGKRFEINPNASNKQFLASTEILLKSKYTGQNLITLESIENLNPILERMTTHLTAEVIQTIVRRLHNCSNTSLIFKLLYRVIIPSITCLSPNPSIMADLYQLLKQLDSDSKAKIYLRWHDIGHPSKLDKTLTKPSATILTARRTHIDRRARGALRRLTKDNVKTMGKTLAKTTLINPSLVFDLIITQIEMFSNMIEPVTESIKSTSHLGYEVLNFFIIKHLHDVSRSPLKEDNINIADWLINLSLFIGKIFKSLLSQDLSKLIVLKSLLVEMADCIPLVDMAESQILALAGGPVLAAGQGKSVSRNEKSTRRLLFALRSTGFLHKLLILLLNLSANAVYQKLNHTKLLSRLQDDCLDSYVLYVQFLQINLDLDEYCTCLENITELIVIKHGLGFLAGRPVLRTSLEGKMINNTSAIFNLNNTSSVVSKSNPNEMVIDKTDKPSDENEDELEDGEQVDKGRFSKVCQTLAQELLKTIVSPDVLFSSEFYIFFWLLELKDIFVPVNKYELEQKQFPEKSQELSSELRDRILHLERTRRDIAQFKTTWFTRVTPARHTEFASQFLQSCLVPRLVLTPVDAIYSARVIRFLHSIGTPNFSTLAVYDAIFNDNTLSALIYSCSDHEASNFGRFLAYIFKDMNTWYNDEIIYNSECRGTNSRILLPGFQKKWSSTKTDEDLEDQLLTHEEFKRLFLKWHRKAAQAFLKLLTSTEYLTLRNAVTVLELIRESQFPMLLSSGKNILQALQRKLESETRDDLLLYIQIYFSRLKKGAKSWVSSEKFLDQTLVEETKEKSDKSTKANTTELDEKRNTVHRGQSIKSSYPNSNSKLDYENSFSRMNSTTPHDSIDVRSLYEERESRSDRELKNNSQWHDSFNDSNDGYFSRETGQNGPHNFAEREMIRRNSGIQSSKARDGRDSRSYKEARDSKIYTDDDDRISRDPNEARSFWGPSDSRSIRDLRESKGSREAREVRQPRENADYRNPRDTRDIRDPRDIRDSRDIRVSRDIRDVRPPRDSRDYRDPRDSTRDSRNTRDSRDGRSIRDLSISRDTRNPRNVREITRDSGEQRNSRKTEDSRISKTSDRLLQGRDYLKEKSDGNIGKSNEIRSQRDSRDQKNQRDHRSERLEKDTKDDRSFGEASSSRESRSRGTDLWERASLDKNRNIHESSNFSNSESRLQGSRNLAKRTNGKNLESRSRDNATSSSLRQTPRQQQRSSGNSFKPPERKRARR